jgi:hypothetical protein
MSYSTEIIYRAIPKSETRLLDRTRELTEDLKWLIDNEESLRKEYPNQYIAVKNKAVLFHASKINELFSVIEKSRGELSDFTIDYVGKEKTALLL